MGVELIKRKIIYNSKKFKTFDPRAVLEKIQAFKEDINPKQIEMAFFHCLETRGSSKYAAIKSYLAEWEKDDH